MITLRVRILEMREGNYQEGSMQNVTEISVLSSLKLVNVILFS